MENESVRIEPITVDHVQYLKKWITDQDTWKWWLRRPPTTEALLKESVSTALTQQERIPLVVYSKDLNTYVGETSFWDLTADTVEIGSTWLCWKARGTGINKTVKQLMIDHAFTEFGVSRIILQTDLNNERSQRAIRGIGGVEFKRAKNDKIVWDGRKRTSVYFEILKKYRIKLDNGASGDQ